MRLQCGSRALKRGLAGADLSFEEVELARPLFGGDDHSAVERLNAWVTEQWGNDQGCVASGSAGSPRTGAYGRKLSVLSLTPLFAVFIDEGDASCPNTAHPSTWHDQHVVEIASGKTIDLWERLSPASRVRLRAQMSALGLRVRDGDACADEYRMERFPKNLVVTLRDEGVLIEPSFSYAVRACVETMSMSMAAFKHQVETDGLVQQLLDTW